MENLVKIIDRQFAAAWAMLGEAIEKLPDEQWRVAEIDFLVPARLAYHIIETVDYYCHDDLRSFEWGGRFGVDWQTDERDRLPSTQAALRYLSEVRRKATDWLRQLGDQALLAPDSVFHSEGMSHLDRASYVLRHTHQHLGELCSELRHRELPRPAWR